VIDLEQVGIEPVDQQRQHEPQDAVCIQGIGT
jgi:hypothetical protein